MLIYQPTYQAKTKHAGKERHGTFLVSIAAFREIQAREMLWGSCWGDAGTLGDAEDADAGDAV